MSNKTIIGVVILGALAIIGIISIQSYWVLKTWDIKSKEFNQSVRIALRKTTEKLAEADQFEIPSKELVTQISSNYYVVNTEASIDATHFREFEGSAFQANLQFIRFLLISFARAVQHNDVGYTTCYRS